MNHHRNGFVTHEEMSLIKEGLKILIDQYNEAAKTGFNPPVLRDYASRRSNACIDLLRVFETNGDKLHL